MRRRTFLKASVGSLSVALVAGTLGGCALPVFPKRPDPTEEDALGWIRHIDGRYELILPRIEFGQNIATALKQIACEALSIPWDTLHVHHQDSLRIARVRSTVGSESLFYFADPLARACATLREALEAGKTQGVLTVQPGPVPQLKSASNGGFIGVSPPLEQGMEIVTGKPIYASDQSLPGMLYGRVLRAPASLERASRPVSWNRAAAQGVPGFVMMLEDAAFDRVESKGLGIVCRTPGALDRVEAALDIQWDIGGIAPLSDTDTAIDVDVRLSEGGLSHTVLDGRPSDAEPWDISLRIDTDYAAHGALEPRVALASYEADGDAEHLRIWAGTQDAFFIRDTLAQTFDLAHSAVTVQACRVGGAFGGKTICLVELEAAILSKAVERPVKVQWTRAQEYRFAFHRPPSSHRVNLRLADDKIADWRHGFVSSHILFTSAALPRWIQRITDIIVGDDGVARGAVPPYRLGATHTDFDLLRLPVHSGPWRGLGAGVNGLVVESAMDEAARAAGQDPVVFRLAHIEDPRLANVLKRVADLAERRPPAASNPPAATNPPAAVIRYGRGVACGIYKGMSYAAVVAEVAVSEDGETRVIGLWCAHDCGRVINPDQVRAQCEGNLVWGISMILLDHLPLEDGFVTAEGFVDAPFPLISDIPQMEIDLIDSTERPSGAGETALVAAPGAIANAIRAATGTRVTRFPVQAGILAQASG